MPAYKGTFWKRRTNESNLEWRIPRWSVTFLGCRLVIVTIPVHLSLAGTSLLILGGPARPPCQQPAPLGNNLCLMNKHIWDLPGPCPGIVIAKLVSSGIQILSLVPSPWVKVQLCELPGISGLWFCVRLQISSSYHLQHLRHFDSLSISVCEDLSNLKQLENV